METISAFQGKYRFLSNFWPTVVHYDGLAFSSVEAAYQAAKCPEAESRLAFQNIGPSEAKKLGRSIRLRSDWDEIKLRVMLDLLREKFGPSHEELREQLRNTGDAELVEGNYWGDRYWGVCNGTGENHLGKLLMQVRQEII
jgi:ribA/ribD-fused uncharacterized protein